MVLVASLYELSRPSSPSGLLHGFTYVFGVKYHNSTNQNILPRDCLC